jgi:D-serine deaminase-like pyridoxal phosphate-dependent protein
MPPTLSKDELRAQFVGKSLHDVQTPRAVLDLAKLELNCARMLDAVARLDLGWRPHIKTHKTTELLKLQVGSDPSTPVNIVVSTILEAENVVPILQEYQQSGRPVNVLYGFPVPPSAAPRLAAVARHLGPGGLSLMLDHPAQLRAVSDVSAASGHPVHAYVKIDMGYRRAGVIPGSDACAQLLDTVLAAEDAGTCVFQGIYAHAGHSYETRRDWQALDYLAAEFASLRDVAALVAQKRPGHALTLSVGASPTATSLQHPDVAVQQGGANQATTSPVNGFLHDLKAQGHKLEVHAGVYPTLDLQQLATHARDASLLSASSIAISILCEVASLYPGRGPAGTTEALINAGCLALGREPCADMGDQKGQHYSGWGIVMPWGLDNPVPSSDFPAKHGGWQVGKVSQEHGILRWKSETAAEVPLEYGQKVRIWPNHSCVAGNGFDFYLVVNSNNTGSEDTIIDVWPRWRGW